KDRAINNTYCCESIGDDITGCSTFVFLLDQPFITEFSRRWRYRPDRHHNIGVMSVDDGIDTDLDHNHFGDIRIWSGNHSLWGCPQHGCGTNRYVFSGRGKLQSGSGCWRSAPNDQCAGRDSRRVEPDRDALVCALTVGGIVKPPLPNSAGDINLSGSTNIGDCLVLALFAGRVNPNFIVPVITSISPSPAIPNNPMTITGSGFAANAADNQVVFATGGGTRVTPTTATPTSLTVM